MYLSRNKVLTLAAITLLSLAGIIIAQFYWVSSTYENQQKLFDERVASIGGQLQQSIRSDSTFHSSLMSLITESSNSMSETFVTQKKLKATIDSLFSQEFADITYEYGLVKRSQDHQAKSIVLFSSIDGNNQTPLLESKYSTCACTFDGLARIAFYFPEKDYFVATQIAGMLVLSLLCLLIVMGCFAFTFFTIRKQKKLAEMKNDFINNMTHEFKTPIFSISLAAKALGKVKEVRESPKVKKYLNLIDDENKRLKDQVNKVLQMALVDSKESSLNKEEVDLHALVKKVAENFDLMLEERNGTIELQLNADKHLVKADETHLSNIFHSLIDNAIKYSEEQPNITITTEDKENGVCFSIADNGIGMDAQTQKHIFDKFYRAHSGDRHDVKGFGLGLSYVKNIVQAHQGRIKLKSKLNKGSTFTVFLPA